VQFFQLGFFWCSKLISISGIVGTGNARNDRLHVLQVFTGLNQALPAGLAGTIDHTT
jgi:hypothetical protein